MSVNLLESIQVNLNYPALKKIDPNTQEVTADDKPEHRFSQAAIPAVLTGLYKYGFTDEGAATILRGNKSTDWVTEIFGEESDAVVAKVIDYDGPLSTNNAKEEMNLIAAEAVRLVKENLPESPSEIDVKNFLAAQRVTILTYLPPSLKMGEFFNDDSIDDNTNKMEGPISSLMHNIGSAFSKPVSEEEIKK